MAADKDDFQAALSSILNDAKRLGISYLGLTAGALHRRVGCYPGPEHRMPLCCDVMRTRMGPTDRIVNAPPKGDGASLLIEYAVAELD